MLATALAAAIEKITANLHHIVSANIEALTKALGAT
jgi:hypothetical protein